MPSRICGIVAFSLVSAHCVSGASISFSGVIDQSSVGGVLAGMPFSGTVSYDPAGLLLGSGLNFANYSVGGAGHGMALQIGAFAFAAEGSLNMMVSDGPNNARLIPNADVLDFSADSASVLSTNYPDYVYFGMLVELTGSLNLVNGNIVPNPIQIEDVFLEGAANPSRVYIFLDPPGHPSSGASVRGTLDSVVVTPEPATAVMLMLGLACGAASLRLRGAGASGRRFQLWSVGPEQARWRRRLRWRAEDGTGWRGAAAHR